MTESEFVSLFKAMMEDVIKPYIIEVVKNEIAAEIERQRRLRPTWVPVK